MFLKKLNRMFPFRGQGFLLVLAIIIATIQHINKANPQGDKIDKLDAGLKTVKEYLPPNANLTLKMPDGAGADLYILWCYLLAPRYCSVDPKEHMDTALTILNINVSDSIEQGIMKNRKTICSSNDGVYKYYVTCNNR